MKYKNKLSKESLVRLEKNPLRILDSKSSEDIEINKNAPKIYEFLSTESKKYFSEFTTMLQNFNISFIENPFLVRGLDYYNNTIFEYTMKNDSKYAVLAGGTYNDLVSDLGGPKISGTGWAAGLERLANLVTLKRNKKNLILIISLEQIFY